MVLNFVHGRDMNSKKNELFFPLVLRFNHLRDVITYFSNVYENEILLFLYCFAEEYLTEEWPVSIQDQTMSEVNHRINPFPNDKF